MKLRLTIIAAALVILASASHATGNHTPHAHSHPRSRHRNRNRPPRRRPQRPSTSAGRPRLRPAHRIIAGRAPQIGSVSGCTADHRADQPQAPWLRAPARRRPGQVRPTPASNIEGDESTSNFWSQSAPVGLALSCLARKHRRMAASAVPRRQHRPRRRGAWAWASCHKPDSDRPISDHCTIRLLEAQAMADVSTARPKRSASGSPVSCWWIRARGGTLEGPRDRDTPTRARALRISRTAAQATTERQYNTMDLRAATRGAHRGQARRAGRACHTPGQAAQARTSEVDQHEAARQAGRPGHHAQLR